jgi:hypothetical protein
MVKLAITLWAFVILWTDASIAQPDSLDDLYTTRAVVTGDERNRPLGFKLCFEDGMIGRIFECHFDPQRIDNVSL